MLNKLSNPEHKTKMLNLLYCRQFILGPHFVDVAPGWRHIEIDPNLKLSIHPEVDVEQTAHANRKLVAIGFMLDSVTPEKTTREILSELINKADNIDALTKATGPYGGRWILIASFGDKKYLFNDPTGLRQVFFTDPAITGALWMVAQPGLAEKFLNLQFDEEAIKYTDSHSFRVRDEFGWPSSSTAFRGLTHLMPNHILDLNAGLSHRFWPCAPIGTMSTEDAEAFITARLTNILRAAAIRYPLAIGMTAGIDSRIVMALAKDISSEIDFVTVRQRKMPDDHPDITIPAELCNKYGLNHVVIKAKTTMSADFSKLFKDNVFMATDIYGPDAEAIINRLQRKKAVITGSSGEIGRCPFLELFPASKYNGPIEAAEIAEAVNYKDEPFVIRHYQAWLDGAVNRYDIQLLDLFNWEQSHGNWVPMTQMQFDIAWREIITPYNCRDVLQAFLSVNQRDRIEPALLLQKNIISRSWPELLEQPINPHQVTKLGAIAKIKRFIKNRIKFFRRLSGR